MGTPRRDTPSQWPYKTAEKYDWLGRCEAVGFTMRARGGTGYACTTGPVDGRLCIQGLAPGPDQRCWLIEGRVLWHGVWVGVGAHPALEVAISRLFKAWIPRLAPGGSPPRGRCGPEVSMGPRRLGAPGAGTVSRRDLGPWQTAKIQGMKETNGVVKGTLRLCRSAVGTGEVGLGGREPCGAGPSSVARPVPWNMLGWCIRFFGRGAGKRRAGDRKDPTVVSPPWKQRALITLGFHVECHERAAHYIARASEKRAWQPSTNSALPIAVITNSKIGNMRGLAP